MKISTNSKLEEQRNHGREGFPFAVYYEDYENYQDKTIGIHWHEEFEFNLVLSGEIEAQIDGQTYHLQTGDAIFVNSNALHMTYAMSAGEPVQQYSVLFLPEFVSAANTSIYMNRIAPIICRKNISAYPLYNSDPGSAAVLTYLIELASSVQQKKVTDDLELHIMVCNLWMILQPLLLSGNDSEALNNMNTIHQERTKRMLSFLQGHYSEKLGVEDIAAAADISRSECFRCFRTHVRKKPIEYLNEYRLKQASKMLVTTTKSISEIAQECGFDHQSYFGKQFKANYHMTPAAYRKQVIKKDHISHPTNCLFTVYDE